MTHYIAQTYLTLSEVKAWMEDHPLEDIFIVEFDKVFIT